MSVADYIDLQHHKPGATQQTIDAMARLGVFSGTVDRVCEIGAGSGRYLERTLAACRPSYYEIYEPAEEWRDWLVARYEVTTQPCDGRSLASTPTASIDLVQAHKVFVYTPFLTSCRYFAEMARVVKAGGHVVFDIVTECCMDEETLAAWLATDLTFPCLMARQYAVCAMESKGLRLLGSFFVPFVRGKSECMVFANAAGGAR